jgi:hypothetical protein
MKTWWNWFFFGFFQTEVEVLDEVQIQATNIRSITYFAYAATMFRSWSWEVVGCQVSRCEEEQLVHEDSDPRPGWEHFWLWSPPFTKIQKMWPKEVMLQESMIPQIEKKYRHNANHWTIIYIYIHTNSVTILWLMPHVEHPFASIQSVDPVQLRPWIIYGFVWNRGSLKSYGCLSCSMNDFAVTFGPGLDEIGCHPKPHDSGTMSKTRKT